MQPPNNELTNAFQFLASTVQDFHISGRPCLGATLKPRLREHHIDESLLGFRKFGDFLRTAEAAGFVRLTSTPGGDIAILPGTIRPSGNPPSVPPPIASVAPAAPVIPVTPAAPIRVRQDLWNAFNSLSGAWVYDIARDMAFKDPHGLLTSRPGMILIPSGRERVAEWMRSFADMQDPDMKAHLYAAIDGGLGLYEFNRLAREKNILRGWSRFHIQSVLAAIEAWSISNNVKPGNLASPLHAPPVTPRVPPAFVPAELKDSAQSKVAPPINRPLLSAASSSILSSRLESVIDSLINELISLRGLLQITGQKTQ